MLIEAAASGHEIPCERNAVLLADIFGTDGIIVVLIIAVIVIFGAGRLPKIARSVGQAKGEFEKGLKDKPENEGEDKGQQPQ